MDVGPDTLVPTVGREDVHAAAARTAGQLRVTPVVSGQVGDGPALLKLEQLQYTGSFKARGILNQVLLAREAVVAAGGTDADMHVVIASGGNAGSAAAWACAQVGLACTVFMPTSSPEIKAERIKSYGADICRVGERYDDAAVAAAAFCDERSATWLHPYDQPGVVAGQGLVFRELEEQLGGEFDTVLVAVGGGGLIGGALAWLGNRARVVSVEPLGSACLYSARRFGKPVDVDVDSIAADSLGARRVGELAWKLADLLADSVVVADAAIGAAQSWLWNKWRLVVEPGGAAATAALLSGAYRPTPGERVVALVCGANADVRTIAGLVPSA